MDRRHLLGLGGMAALFAPGAAEAAAPGGPFQQNHPRFRRCGGLLRSTNRARCRRPSTNWRPRGRPSCIPAGNYRAQKLVLPANATVLGVPGLSVLTAPGKAPIFESAAQDVSLRGVTFAGCGLLALDCRNLSICDRQVVSSPTDGIVCTGTGLFIAGNRAASCAKAAIWASGDGMVTNNLVSGPGQFGLRIGSPAWLGTLTVMNNRIEGTAVGIAASDSDKGYAVIAMNMIVRTKNGGIRALNGEEATGWDLTHNGSEAFRNLAIAANISL